jgi:aryl-alcohol dehydrogenase-like predicted oxidoreductase
MAWVHSKRKPVARQLKIDAALVSFCPMRRQRLGNSDIRITRFGFGAWAAGGGGWQFGWSAQDDKDSIAAIHAALELGINWIDTAAVYGLGHSEEVVAKALREWPGTKPYVFTKCGTVWDDRREVAYSLKADSVRRECDDSLRRLNREVIDLYQIHWPADDSPETQEGWATLAELQRRGKFAGLEHRISAAPNFRPPNSLRQSPLFSLRIRSSGAISKRTCCRFARSRDRGDRLLPYGFGPAYRGHDG